MSLEPKTPLPSSLQKPLSRFYEYLRSEKGLSLHTQRNYKQQLETMAAHLVTLGLKDWGQVDAAWVRQLASKGMREGMKASSIATRLSSLRSFFDFLVLRGEMTANPAKGVSAPRKQRPLPKNLDVAQMASLLEINDDDPLAIRDKAMMELMYSSGLRISELVGTNLRDINAANGEILVKGKGNKERLIPVGRKALTALKNWLNIRGQFAKPDEMAVFLSSKKNRIAVRQVRLRMQEWGIKQGISSQVHPHKLRHSFASHILESSGDLRAVQELLGHSSLSATQVYTHLDFQHLAKVYDNTHPRAKKQTD